MSGVQGQMLGHLVRRGVTYGQEKLLASSDVKQLQHDAQLYEKAGPDMEIKPEHMIPVLITFIFVMILIASIRYTVGEVIASLSMIESQTTTAIIDDKPPAYTDEPDAPLEKEADVPSEVDVEVTLIRNKPITAKITTTIGHMTRIGGFCARWRGLGLSILYHSAHNVFANFLSRLLGFGLFGHAFMYIITSIGLARLHMVWTHSMIAYPSRKPFWRRMVPRKQCKALLLPSLVFAVAQQAAILLPIGVALMLRITPELDGLEMCVKQQNCKDLGRELAFLGLRLIAVVATGVFVMFSVLLPASVTLTRIEAALLPEGEETIVPFDRQAIMGDIDLSVRGGCRALFVQAWRSFDRAARWRLIKLYLKMVLIQVTVFIAGLHLMVLEVYVIGGEKLALLFKSGSAQLKLMAIEAQQDN